MTTLNNSSIDFEDDDFKVDINASGELEVLHKPSGKTFTIGDGDSSSVAAAADELNAKSGTLSGELASPLSGGTQKKLKSRAGDNTGASTLLRNSNGEYVLIYNKARTQWVDDGVRAAISEDLNTWRQDKRISFGTQSSSVSGGPAAVMDSGRLGAMCRGDNNNPVFAYSDDGGETWSDVDLGLSGYYSGFHFHGPYNGQYIVYYHNGNSEIAALTTSDNGASWTDEGAVATYSGITWVVEPEVVEKDGKHIMVARDDDDGSRTPIWTSEDPLSFGSGQDAGIGLGQNRPLLGLYNGLIHFVAASREYFGNEIEDFGDTFVQTAALFDTIYDDPTAWPPFREFSSPRKGPHGYGHYQIYDDEIYLTMTTAEQHQDNIADTHGFRDIVVYTNKRQLETARDGEATRVVINGTQSFQNNTETEISFQMPSYSGWTFDDLGVWDETNGEIILSEPGRYRVTLNARGGNFDFSNVGSGDVGQYVTYIRIDPRDTTSKIQDINYTSLPSGAGTHSQSQVATIEGQPGDRVYFGHRGGFGLTGDTTGGVGDEWDTWASITKLS